MSLIPEFVEPQKSSAGKLSLVQYESGQQEGEGRAAKTPKKRYFILKLLFVINFIIIFYYSPRLLNLAGTQAGKQSTGSKVATTRLTLILPLGRNHKYLRSYSTTGNIPNFTLKNKLNLLE